MPSEKSMDSILRRLRQQEPPWKDIRERRVLVKTQEMRAAQLPRPYARPFAIAAAVAIAVIGTVLIGHFASRSTDVDQTLSAHWKNTSLLSLDDMGRAVLHAGAEVEVVRRRQDQLELAQSKGTVRYELKRRMKKEVTVRVLGITIHVVGTVFTVAVDPKRVQVIVFRGTVRVDDAEQMITLTAGEELAVARTDVAVTNGIRSSESVSTVDRDDDTINVEAEALDIQRSRESLPSDRNPRISVNAATDRKQPVEPSSGGLLESQMPQPPAATEPSVDEALAQIDLARRQGRFKKAAGLIQALIDQNPQDPRMAALFFTLGNVERAQRNHLAAAKAYQQCWEYAPKGPLAEDARAEQAVSLSNAGRPDLAREAAKRYLSRYPVGIHRARMLEII
ncbi:MAG: tetratricopeptide repeat protein [Myxococcota bacterium]|nr:tetratricopeptide repeat protein [Myxococcota bacterium]